MTRRTLQAHPLAAVAAGAGVLQLTADLELALSSETALARAIREGPAVYLGATGALVLAAALVVWQWRRPPLIRVSIALPGVIAAVGLVWILGTRVGLAYHGELVLHHFLAVLCAAIAAAVPIGWARDRELGALRHVPLAAAAVGVAALLVEHLARAPGDAIGLMGQVGAASLLAAPPLALACLWRRLQPPALRAAALLLMVPLGLRVGLGGAGALKGMSLGTDAAGPLFAAIGAAVVLGVALVRPRAERGLHGAALALAAIACAGLHRAYTQRFGDLEAPLGGLARSLLGFDPPYPAYLPAWAVISAMLALFLVFASAFAMVLSQRDHLRGLCLILLIAAGLGLTNPQLVLMCGAALLLTIDTLVHGQAPAPRASQPTRPVEAVVAEVAQRLGLPAPVVLEQERGAVVALRGELEGTSVELRAKQERRGWRVTLQAGVLGRGAPELELRPGASASEAHPLLPGHGARGDARRLERVPEALLQALAAFPGHRTRLWAGGCQVELGGELAALEAGVVAEVLRGMSRTT